MLRASIVLLADEGRNNSEIAEELKCDVQTARKWRSRFATDGMEGLVRPPSRGTPLKVRDGSAARGSGDCPWSAPASTLYLDPRFGGGGSARKEYCRVNQSRETLSYWLRTADIKPHRNKYWLNSKDPKFREKMERVVDLYINKPEGARVICIDEKTCIQALERLHPDKPVREGRPRRLEFGFRHGTTHLVAAFDVHTGEVLAECVDKNDSDAFIRFLCRLRRKYRGEKLYLILDNGTTHRSRKTRRFLRHHPFMGEAIFLPTHASWLNQIEIWFSALTRQALRHFSCKARESGPAHLRLRRLPQPKRCTVPVDQDG